MFDGFVQNAAAKTPSFFLAGGVGAISSKMQKELVELGEKTGDTVRLCLFNSPEDLLQLMVIFHPYKKNIDIQKFTEQTSIYTLIDGEFEIELLDDNFESQERIHLCKTGNVMARIPSGRYYKMRILSDTLLFTELRNGPYKKENQIIVSSAK